MASQAEFPRSIKRDESKLRRGIQLVTGLTFHAIVEKWQSRIVRRTNPGCISHFVDTADFAERVSMLIAELRDIPDCYAVDGNNPIGRVTHHTGRRSVDILQ